MIELLMIVIGGVNMYWRNNPTLVFEDLKVYKPNLLALVPRILNKIYANIFNEIKSKGWLVQSAFWRAYKSVENRYKTTGEINHTFFENMIFKKIKQVLGGNVRTMITGSAPIKEDVLDFLKIVFGVVIGEGYGLTESTATASSTIIKMKCSGNVGYVTEAVLLRLKDQKEMGYTSEDVPEN